MPSKTFLMIVIGCVLAGLLVGFIGWVLNASHWVTIACSFIVGLLVGIAVLKREDA